MITEFDEFDNGDDFLSSKPKKINEGMSNEELLKDLRDATYIYVEYNKKDKGWGVTYIKNKERKTEGCFDKSDQVHEFLIQNGINYEGKEGYDYMRKYRGEDTKLYYRKFIY
jgi:hypothetical protein